MMHHSTKGVSVGEVGRVFVHLQVKECTPHTAAPPPPLDTCAGRLFVDDQRFGGGGACRAYCFL